MNPLLTIRLAISVRNGRIVRQTPRVVHSDAAPTLRNSDCSKESIVTTTYASKHVDNAKPKRNKRKIIVVSAIAGTLLAPAAAWAAVELFGFGTFESGATTTQELVITDTALTNSLAPGQTVGVKGIVKNTNDFPVKVTGIIVKNSSVTVSGGTPTECAVTYAGGSATTFPAHGSVGSGPGTGFTLASPVNLDPGQSVWVTVPNVIKQDASATKLCTVKADYAVRGIVGTE